MGVVNKQDMVSVINQEVKSNTKIISKNPDMTKQMHFFQCVFPFHALFILSDYKYLR